MTPDERTARWIAARNAYLDARASMVKAYADFLLKKS